MATTTTINLTPSAGFCIKSSIISTKTKIFVNIAYDTQVPPPQTPSDDYTTWFVPVVVSDGRKDTDKAGSPCLVFDCVYNTMIKSRILRDTDGEFKVFIIELSLQRIEAQSNNTILLSRQIKTPNIASKGKLNKRTVTVPTSLLEASGTPAAPAAPPTKKLIEELTPTSQKPKPSKSILKNVKPEPSPIASTSSSTIISVPAYTDATSLNRPSWSWSLGSSGNSESEVKLTILVPSLTYSQIEKAELDLSPSYLRLHVPSLYHLEIDLELSDAEIIFNASSSGKSGAQGTSISASDITSSPDPSTDSSDETKQILSLKRHVRTRGRTTQSSVPTPPSQWLKSDDARAEWIVKKGVLVVYV